MPDADSRVAIQSITSPHQTQRVDRAKYMAMREALMAVLPRTSPGRTVAEAKEALLPMLPEALFPGGATAGWWLKAVQLDLEDKGVIARISTRPVRLVQLAVKG